MDLAEVIGYEMLVEYLALMRARLPAGLYASLCSQG